MSTNCGALSVSAMCVEEESALEIPVTVTMACAAVAELEAVRVSCADAAEGLSSQVALTPAGSADVTAKWTLLLNPA